MSDPSRFRDAATVNVDASPERVRELISDPRVLGALDERLSGEDVEVKSEEGRVEVWDEDERLHLAFRLTPEGEGTHIAAVEDIEPEGLIEQTKWRLFPGRAHDELEDELDRFRHLAEAFETTHGA